MKVHGVPDSNWMVWSWPYLPGGRVPWLHWRHLQRYAVLHLPTQKSSLCEAQMLPARLPLPIPASLLQPHRAVQLHWWVRRMNRDDLRHKINHLSQKALRLHLYYVCLCSIWRLPKWGSTREHSATHREWWSGCHGGKKERHPGPLQLLLPGFYPLLVSTLLVSVNTQLQCFKFYINVSGLQSYWLTTWFFLSWQCCVCLEAEAY